jgi:hypothetical protein
VTLCVKEQVLWLDVTVSDALAVQVCDAVQNLLEAAFDFRRRHAAFLDRGVEVAAGTKLHHFAPVLVFILNEVNGLDNVDVVQRRRYAELGGEFLDILLLCFVLSSFAELLREKDERWGERV